MLHMICPGFLPSTPTQKDPGVKTPFPRMTSLADFPASTTPAQKLVVLTEQYLLAYYFYTCNKETLYADYLKEVRLHLQKLPAYSNDGISGEQYEQLYGIAQRMLSRPAKEWAGVARILNQTNLLTPDQRLLSRLFYEPLLYSLAGAVPSQMENKTILRPELYLPKLHRQGDKLYAVRRVVPFTAFHCKPTQCRIDNDNPVYQHLSRLDWRGKSFMNLVDVLAGFHTQPGRTHTSLPAAMHAGLFLTKSPVQSFRQQCTEFTSLLSLLHKDYRISISDVTGLGDYLQRVGDYPNLRYLTADKPTVRDAKEFAHHADLAFLKGAAAARLTLALEADNPESSSAPADDDEDERPAEKEGDDNDIGEPADSPDGGDDVDKSADPGDDLDLGEGDDDLDADGGGSDDFGSSSGDTAEVSVTDTPPEEEKKVPDMVNFIVSAKETLDESLFRERARAAIEALLISPPMKMSQHTLRFLRVWTTEWIDVVSVDTTRDILAYLTDLLCDEDKAQASDHSSAPSPASH